MAQSFSQSVIIVGGGITGLTIAVALQASGHKVTLIARDAPGDTASGIAAGMIAPAMEAMNEPEPVFSFQRLKAAQASWLELFDIWPKALQRGLAETQSIPTLYIWDVGIPSQDIHEAGVRKRLADMGALHNSLNWDEVEAAGFDPENSGGTRIAGDWLVDAATTLAALQAHFEMSGGRVLRGAVNHVMAQAITLEDSQAFTADHIVVAAGYEARAFESDIPCLAVLEPIKGHLLDIPGQGGLGVKRAASGYLADYGDKAKFGATMQMGQADLQVEAEVVSDLKVRATMMNVEFTGAVPRTGIRASTPDGWPMIGRDPASDVLVATGMRRNGYIFAPFAAQIILALVEGRESPDAGIYRPDRFHSPEN